MQLSSEQLQIQATARAFAAREIAPYVRSWENEGGAPRSLYRKMAEAGLMSVCVAPEHGGAGADFIAYALAIEEIAAVDGGISNVMAATNSPVAAALSEHGTPRQKDLYLRGICDGRLLGSIHLTEPHTGSDAAAITTRAVRDGDEWVLNGRKAYITAGRSSWQRSDTVGNAGAKIHSTAVNDVNGCHDFLGGHIFQNITSCAAFDGRCHILIIIMHTQNQDPCPRQLSLQPAGGFADDAG